MAGWNFPLLTILKLIQNIPDNVISVNIIKLVCLLIKKKKKVEKLITT